MTNSSNWKLESDIVIYLDRLKDQIWILPSNLTPAERLKFEKGRAFKVSVDSLYRRFIVCLDDSKINICLKIVPTAKLDPNVVADVYIRMTGVGQLDENKWYYVHNMNYENLIDLISQNTFVDGVCQAGVIPVFETASSIPRSPSIREVEFITEQMSSYESVLKNTISDINFNNSKKTRVREVGHLYEAKGKPSYVYLGTVKTNFIEDTTTQQLVYTPDEKTVHLVVRSLTSDLKSIDDVLKTCVFGSPSKRERKRRPYLSVLMEDNHELMVDQGQVLSSTGDEAIEDYWETIIDNSIRIYKEEEISLKSPAINVYSNLFQILQPILYRSGNKDVNISGSIKEKILDCTVDNLRWEIISTLGRGRVIKEESVEQKIDRLYLTLIGKWLSCSWIIPRGMVDKVFDFVVSKNLYSIIKDLVEVVNPEELCYSSLENLLSFRSVLHYIGEDKLYLVNKLSEIDYPNKQDISSTYILYEQDESLKDLFPTDSSFVALLEEMAEKISFNDGLGYGSSETFYDEIETAMGKDGATKLIKKPYKRIEISTNDIVTYHILNDKPVSKDIESAILGHRFKSIYILQP